MRIDAEIDVLETGLWEHQEWEDPVRTLFEEFDSVSSDYVIRLILSAVPGTESLDEAAKTMQLLETENPEKFYDIISTVYEYIMGVQLGHDDVNETEFAWHKHDAQEFPGEESEYDEFGMRIDPYYYVELEFLFEKDKEGHEIQSKIDKLLEVFPDVYLVDETVLWDKDDEFGADEGGVALYDLYPKPPGLLQEIQSTFKGFDYTLDVLPSRGFSPPKNTKKTTLQTDS